MLFKPVRTPCIGICSTGIGDDVCRGCKRFSHEVIDWNGYSHEQRRIIANRLESFLAQVVENYFVIVDQAKLAAQMTHQQIRFQREQNPYCWVFDLLKAGASQIENVADFGLSRQRQCEDESLTAIKQSIDSDFFQLSQAHFERYIGCHYPSEDSSTA